MTGPGETDEGNQRPVVASSSLPEKKPTAIGSSPQVQEKRDAFVGCI